MNASTSNPSVGRHVLTADGTEQVQAMERDLLNALSEQGYNDTCAFAIRLAVHEGLANAFRHGNRGDAAKTATVEYTVSVDQVVIEVQDEGDGFSPESVPDPTEDENIAIPSGRGIMLMRSFMTSVQFIPPGNCVRMTYAKPT